MIEKTGNRHTTTLLQRDVRHETSCPPKCRIQLECYAQFGLNGLNIIKTIQKNT
jgi:hypothetical protein